MKSKFSTAWLSSSQPRKQRKYQYNAPLHIKHKFLNAHLSKPLREKYGKRSLPLKKGDEVLVMRGSFVKKKAKISSIQAKRTRVILEGIQRSKKDGTKVNVFFHPSSLQIQTLNLEDKKRFAILEKNKPKESNIKAKEKKNALEKTGSNN